MYCSLKHSFSCVYIPCFFDSGAVLASFFPDQSLIVTQSRRNQTTSKEESGACSQLANSLPKEFDRIEACGDWLFQILNLFRSFFTYLAVLKRHKSGSRCKMLLLECDSGHFRAPKRRGHWIEENRSQDSSSMEHQKISPVGIWFSSVKTVTPWQQNHRSNETYVATKILL